jgi:RNA polymerase sigma-70 factor (ECF subfamily)
MTTIEPDPEADRRSCGILTTTFLNSCRAQWSRSRCDSVAESEDQQPGRAAPHLPASLCSAEIEALDRLPDTDVEAALRTLPAGFRITVIPKPAPAHREAA